MSRHVWLDCQGPLFFKKVDIQGTNNKIEVTVENFFPKIYMAIIVTKLPKAYFTSHLGTQLIFVD